ncbi:MAG: T9SS type A sorting domain-containing protein [Cryomorphaceae bacterium]
MARLSTLIVLLALSLSSFAQLSVTMEDSTVCPGESVWLKASGMTVYAWSDTVNLDTNFVDSVNFSTTTPGNYTITVLGYTFVPVDTDTVTISILVHANAMVSITSSAGSSFCQGSSSELVATSGHASYSWTPSGTLDNDSTDTVIASPTAATTYYVTIVDSNGCMGMDSIDLDVTSGPTVTISSSVEATGGYLCSGNTATMTANASGIATYEWSPTATLNDSTSMSVQATPTATTTYTVVVTDTNGCTGSTSLEIVVNSVLPSLTVNIADDTICFGTSTEISCQSNGTSFSWSPSGSLDDPTAKDVIASPTSTTTYSVTATRLGCSKTGTATITVIPAPAISATQSSGGASICLDETDEITVTCPDCLSYVWKFPGSTLNTTSNTQVVSPNVPGAINITISGIDANGCKGVETVTVNVDDCFVGTPFGIGEYASEEIRVLNQGSQIEFVSASTISEVQLYNLLGEQVMNVQNRDNSVLISSEQLASGVYVARVTVNGKLYTEKVYLK